MSKKTVFIIGAGASKEANLPTGTELKGEIAKLIDFEDDQNRGDSRIIEAIHQMVRDSKRADELDSYANAARHISSALPLAISIDNFIDAHRDDAKIALCGKLAIVRSILNAERRSALFKKDDYDFSLGVDFSKIENTWYLSFFQLITENCRKEDLGERFAQISLIIFNYDRCVEHFLFNALKHYYKMSGEETTDLIGHLQKFHPYGKAGDLPWSVGDENRVKFGADVDTHKLLDLSQKIKTFAEGTNPESSDITSIKKCMLEADRLAYLGFAFHEMNMQLIAPNKNSANKWRTCYATVFNISKSDQETIKNHILRIYNNQVHIKMVNTVCVNFFSEFWRSLAF